MKFRKSGLTWIVLLSVMLSGCISRWTEDVELGDGTIIKVTRTEKYGGGGGIGESCNFCTFEWARLSFEYNGKRYRWKSLPKSDVPMIVDIVDGYPVVVSCSRYRLCGKSKAEDFSEEKSFYLYAVDGGSGWEYERQKPGGIRSTRNPHKYKPGYGSGISVSEKNDWVEGEINSGGDHGKFSVILMNDASAFCAN